MDTLIVVDERHDYIPQVVAGHYLRMAGCSVVNMAEDYDMVCGCTAYVAVEVGACCEE
jgi:hypothetical protein